LSLQQAARIDSRRISRKKEWIGMADMEKSLHDRLGGVFAIAAVVDHFSDEVVKNPKVGQGSPNPS
jgi:hypothetical protein